MKKTLLASVALAFALGMSGPSMANGVFGGTTGQPGNGNQLCMTPEELNGSSYAKNPGWLLRYIRMETGYNPKRALEELPSDPGEFANVGEAINDTCGQTIPD